MNDASTDGERPQAPARPGDQFEFRGRVWRTRELCGRYLVGEEGVNRVSVDLDRACLVKRDPRWS